MSYSVHDYGDMIGDSIRMKAYVKALQKTVKSNSVVLDLGAGTGIFSLLACRFGARKVYAIEPNNAIHVAKQLAQKNGFANRIEFFQESSIHVKLPEKVDTIVSDLRGVLPINSYHLPSIIDARNRFLKPNGTLIPQKDQLLLSVAEAPKAFENAIHPWKKNHFNFNFTDMQFLFVNQWHRVRSISGRPLSNPVRLKELDYLRVSTSNFEEKVQFEIENEGTGHGFFLWFDATILEGISFSSIDNAPKGTVYGCSFFPWEKPVELTKGNSVTIKIRASLINQNYIVQWDSNIYTNETGKTPTFRFKQSTFHGQNMPIHQLKKRATNFVPNLNEEGAIDQRILNMMATHTPLEGITQEILNTFPNRFKKRSDALSHIGELSQKYCR